MAAQVAPKALVRLSETGCRSRRRRQMQQQIPCDPRDRRQRGRTCGQMQKISTGKFHFEPPFTSFDHLVGQRQQLVRDFEAERLRGPDVEHELEFGGAYDREISWLLALENPRGIDAGYM